MSKGRRGYLTLRRKRLWRRVCGFICLGVMIVGVMVGLICTSKLANNTGIQKTFAVVEGGGSALPKESLDEFSQNDILFYFPCDSVKSGGSGQTTAGGCAKLAELRQAMWNEASEEDKKHFINVVSKEDAGLAAVEAFMNQVLYYNKGLSGWLSGMCPRFMAHGEICSGSKDFSDKEQTWTNKALGGSNITNVATGNAYGHSNVTVKGAVTCIWVQDTSLEDNGKCANVDYSKPIFTDGSKTGCSTLVEEARKEDSSIPTDPNHEIECWGWDNTTEWSSSMASQCGGNNSLGSTQSGSTSTSGTSTGTSAGNGANAGPGASSSITWDKEGWITGGMDGFKKEESGGDGYDKYEHGKPNKIVLHYTQGEGKGIGAYAEKRQAPHFTIDLLDKEVSQHVPLSKPSGALAGTKGGPSDTYDNIQIEIVGYGFKKDNPDNPGPDSKCIIDGEDKTSSKRCFAKYGDAEWGYLAQLLKGINKWGKENTINIPLDSSVKWTGDTGSVRLNKDEYDKTVGIVAHMHVPHNDHDDTGNIWPMVQAALGQVQCDLNGDENSVSGAKNAEKQANEVGPMTFGDNDNESMKKLLENYGDLAYRTGQAYGVPWVAVLVQGRYEDPKAKCGNNNYWGIGCSPGTKEGGGSKANSIGEGFALYGKTVHNGNYEDALKETDPYEYLKKLGPMWVQGDKNGAGYGSINDMKKSIEALNKYIESDEGQQVVAQFGATSCDKTEQCSIDGNASMSSNQSILAAVQKVIDLANENGSEYSYGGGRSISHFNDVVNNNAQNNIDCTGFASMVYWMVYGDEFDDNDIFDSRGIIDGKFPSYKEVDRSEVRPGDIFAYDGHGGIVVEVDNGKVTKIAETGGKEGRSGKNNNIGYSGKSDYSVRHMNTDAGHFYRWKGDNS